MTDSPVGQPAWIAERFAQWTDPRSPVSDDRMLKDISLYWLTATAASSTRLYQVAPRGQGVPCPVPLAVAMFAHDITQSVRPLAERLFDIRHWWEFDRGGHFAAMEVPQLLAEDVRDFFLARIGYGWWVHSPSRSAATASGSSRMALCPVGRSWTCHPGSAWSRARSPANGVRSSHPEQ